MDIRENPPKWWVRSPELWAYRCDVLDKLHVGSRAVVGTTGGSASRYTGREVLITMVHHNPDGQRNGIIRAFPVAAERGEIKIGEYDLGAVTLQIDTIKAPPRDILEDIERMGCDPSQTAFTVDRHLVMQFRTDYAWEGRAYDRDGRRTDVDTSSDEYASDRWLYLVSNKYGGRIGRQGE